ncbi:major capsid protein [Halodesulfovibrio aestuarii]|uniref:Major capsid protein n=1 Tax=Halodesulfovibrio aestuarii TaxID=126333 RepID=A0ABV4JX21_9BACT
MSLDLLFRPRTLTSVAVQRKPVPRLIQSLFFKRGIPLLSDTVDLRKISVPMYVLPMVSEVSGATAIPGASRQVTVVPTARFRPSRPSSATDLLNVTANGESVELKPGMGNMLQRVNDAVALDIAVLDDSIEASIELMCSDLLRTGIVTAHADDGISYKVDYQMPTDHVIVLSGTDLWTDPASDPEGLYEDVAQIIQDKTGMRPDTVVQGNNAWRAFRNNAKVKEELNNRGVQSGNRIINIGNTYKGDPYNMAHYVYGGSLPDVHGNTRPLWLDDYVLFGVSDAPCTIEFGLPTDAENTGPTEKFVKSKLIFDPSAIKIVEESRPLATADMRYFFLVKVV